MNASRRDFLCHTLGSSIVLSLGASSPLFWQHAAQSASVQEGPKSDTILVIVQLSGGNDGLNTIIPASDPAYQQLRPSLAIAANQTLSIADGIGWHPSMRAMADLLEAGHVAVVQGVGYPQPNRSHFESMDIWHTGYDKSHRQDTGWLGRYVDATGMLGPTASIPAIHLGEERQPLALQSRASRIPTIGSLKDFRLDENTSGKSIETIRALTQIERDRPEELLAFVQASTVSALMTSDRIARIRRSDDRAMSFPDTHLGNKLSNVYQLIDAGLGTRLFYVTLDGFDTHAKQGPAHEALLRQVSEAVGAFTRATIEGGYGERVATMIFSEFGRRVSENASAGTDHGAAAPLFVVGPRVRPGLVGPHPSLTDLDDGDLRFHTDFRQVYASILSQWLEWDPDPILGQAFSPIEIFDSAV